MNHKKILKDIKMVVFYKDYLGFEIEWDGNGRYAKFKHNGIRFSMYEPAQLPELLDKFQHIPTV